MKIKTLISVLATASFITAVPAIAEDITEAKPVTEQIVDTLTTLSGGPHAGFRSNHAKGVMLERNTSYSIHYTKLYVSSTSTASNRSTKPWAGILATICYAM